MNLKSRSTHLRLLSWGGTLLAIFLGYVLAVNWGGPIQTIPLSLEESKKVAWNLESSPADWSGNIQFGDRSASLVLRETQAGHHLMRLQLDRSAQRPDLLLYWSQDPPARTLPQNALLLGSVPDTHSRVYQLPDSSWTGHLILYSLGHQELLGSAPLPVLGEKQK